MTRTTTNLLGIVITILAGIYFYMTCCSSCLQEAKATEPEQVNAPPPKVQEPTNNPFVLSDGDLNYKTEDNFNFRLSSNEFIQPLSNNVATGISSNLSNYLVEQENKVVNLVGYYKSDEENNTAFPNLGVARANSVKNYLISQNIPSSKINIDGELKDEMLPDGDTLRGPIDFKLDEVAANAQEELNALYKKIKDNPLILYFNTAEASIDLNVEQRQKVADITRYLDKVPDALCEITGYTDSKGSNNTNIRLGQERADFAKSYLVSNGISENKITTASKGKANPIATNETEEGRAKNRRTVISIK